MNHSQIMHALRYLYFACFLCLGSATLGSQFHIPSSAIDSLPVTSQHLELRRPKIGLVLSGGAARGIAHVGVLKVLKEAGISVDFVGGTSMGSIVGAMVAMGYDADTIEKIFLNQDWTALLADEVSRNSYSIEEKEELQKFVVSFPFSGYFPKLPIGVKEGHNISNLLARYTLPYADINDFNKLPKPYLCIATDIASGQQVILNKGRLADALRASMAIPTVFTPVIIDGKLLVDGGLVNNFPVEEVKAMGADIIIGVNLGFRPYAEEELNSLTAILEQSIFLPAYERNKQNMRLCNVLIEPDVYSISRAGFNDVKKLIAIGETAARVFLPQLKALADSLNNIAPPSIDIPLSTIDTVHIDKFAFEGLHNVSRDFLLGKLRIRPPCTITVDELEGTVDRMYGTQFFDKVGWRLDDSLGLYTLVITAQEKKADFLRVGGRYDSDFNANMLLNIVLHNKIIKGSKLYVDAVLGEFRHFRASYLVHTGWERQYIHKKVGRNPLHFSMFPELGLNFEYNKLEIFKYENGEKTSSYDYSQTKIGIVGLTSVSNAISSGISLNTEFSSINPILIQDGQDPARKNNLLLNATGFLKLDSYNSRYYPTHGSMFNANLEWAKDISGRQFKLDNTLRFTGRFDHAATLSKNLSLITSIYTGFTHGDSIAPDYYLFCGGMYPSHVNKGYFPMVGTRFMQFSEKNALIGGLDLQYEVARNHFIILKYNVAKLSPKYTDLLLFEHPFQGIGLTYGYNSLAGPLEFTLMRSTELHSFQYYLSLGFWF